MSNFRCVLIPLVLMVAAGCREQQASVSSAKSFDVEESLEKEFEHLTGRKARFTTYSIEGITQIPCAGYMSWIAQNGKVMSQWFSANISQVDGGIAIDGIVFFRTQMD